MLSFNMKDIPDLPIIFAELLRECREECGYSQRKLAATIGCARSYITFLKDGEHTRPSIPSCS
jgi:DNA-binding XRE family transcriptional regulator